MAQNSEDYISYLEKQLHNCLPGNSIDCVIFGYQNQELHILVLKWKYEKVWALPGGFIHLDEDIGRAAHRVLSDRTGLDSLFLRQFHTFGKKNRNVPNGKAQLNTKEKFIKKFRLENQSLIDWISKRFISTGYLALVDIEKTDPRPDPLSEKCEWRAIKKIPPLILDHDEIVQKALEQLRIQLNYLPVGFSLLPEKFTMQDLQKLYEAILLKRLERSNFQRKILKLDFLNRHGKQMTGAANKAPYLYSFDREKYEKLLQEGIGFSF